MNDATCPIWETPCQKIALPGGQDAQGFNSPRAGGKYIISRTAASGMAPALDELSKVKLSRRIYEQNQLGETPEIHTDILREAKTWLMPSVPEQMDYCLQFLESKIGAWGETADYHFCSDEIQAATLLKNDDEAVYLIKEFINEDWIKIKPGAESNSGLVVIRLKGYLQLEELKKTNVASA